MSLRKVVFQRFESQLVWLLTRLRSVEETLSAEDDWVEDDRRLVFEWLDSHFEHPFTFQKGREDYFCTVDISPDEAETILNEEGYHRNLLSTRKYRILPNGTRQYAKGSWVVDGIENESSKYIQQHHIYLFKTEDGGTDMYGHKETSVTEGKEHITETNQIHGDPDMTVRNALDRHNIEYYTNDRFE